MLIKEKEGLIKTLNNRNSIYIWFILFLIICSGLFIYIIIENRKKIITEKVAEFNAKHGENTAEIEIKEQYRNMKQQFEGKMHIVEIAEQAMKDANIEPKIKAIRGGTDGAQLSYMGLPCPNIFAGGHYFHGPYEFVPIENMEAAVKIIVNIAQSIK